MIFDKEQILKLYRKRAANYDLTANLYYLIGVRERKYRKLAVHELRLKPGDTVIEIGCGTGLNFSILLSAVGAQGKVLAVDLTDAMLEKARARIQRKGWSNIELIHTDAAKYDFPKGINGVISTFAITLIPEYEDIIERASLALRPGGRMVIADLRKPERWPIWLIKLGVLITRPFGVSLNLSERRPWKTMKKYFSNVEVTTVYGGAIFLAVGKVS